MAVDRRVCVTAQKEQQAADAAQHPADPQDAVIDGPDLRPSRGHDRARERVARGKAEKGQRDGVDLPARQFDEEALDADARRGGEHQRHPESVCDAAVDHRSRDRSTQTSQSQSEWSA